MKPVYETFKSENINMSINFHKDHIVNETQSANWHKSLELLYVISGEGNVIYNFKRYNIKKGDLIVVNSNSIHQLSSMNEMTVYCIIIKKDFCDENGISLEKTFFTEIIQDSFANKLFEDFMSETHIVDSFSHLSISLSVVKLLIYLTRNHSESDNTPISNKNTFKYQRIQKAINYIEKHYHEKINIEQIADYVHINKFYLSHEFKKITNTTINEMINNIRCTQAKKLLLDNELTATKISDMCGFENYAYFSNVFKKIVGVSPSDYRKHIITKL